MLSVPAHLSVRNTAHDDKNTMASMPTSTPTSSTASSGPGSKLEELWLRLVIVPRVKRWLLDQSSEHAEHSSSKATKVVESVASRLPGTLEELETKIGFMCRFHWAPKVDDVIKCRARTPTPAD